MKAGQNCTVKKNEWKGCVLSIARGMIPSEHRKTSIAFDDLIKG
jgi:hypothetical protein